MAQRPKSVLCMSLVSRSGACWLVYLENTVAATAFTPQQLQVLELLASQAAISLENAVLYKDLDTERERFRIAFDEAPNGMVILDRDSAVLQVNDAFTRLLGHAKSEVIGAPFTTIVDRDVWDPQVVADRVGVGAHTQPQIEVACLHAQGHMVWTLLSISRVQDIRGDIVCYLVQVHDVTERRQFIAAIEHQALHDALTDLPNRALLNDRLDLAIRRAEHDPRSVAVAFIDLDRFELVNDSLGHGTGDRLLVMVAERLLAVLGATESAARFGGDEFVMISEGVDADADVEEIAERVAGMFDRSFELDGRESFVTASIGIALTGGTGQDSDTALAQADAAMHRAKAQGRARYQVFHDELTVRAQARLQLENELRLALERDEFRVFYQPIVDISTARIVGTETLVRWDHPTRGLVNPVEFIPAAEETGLIVPLGAWVMRESVAQLSAWRRRFPAARTHWVGVNVSVRQLADAGCVAMTAEALAAAGLDPKWLHIEVTESALMSDVERSIQDLSHFKALGVHLAIDDFLTGHSSLNYLKQLPIDTLKIDRSFVDGLGTDPENTSIVRAVIDMGRAFGLTLLAEGVETELQLTELREMGCDLGQGYLWNRPLPPEQLEAWLAAGK